MSTTTRAAGLSPRGPLAALTVLLAGALLALAASTPAAATPFRYWSYWQGASGAWVASGTGPDQHALVDEDVQGWRFAITTDQPAQPPDNSPDFAALCPELAAGTAPAGQLRVAVVIDPGFLADAPSGQTRPGEDRVACVTVPVGSTGAQALGAAAAVQTKDGLVCSLDGYPQGECGAAVPESAASAAAAAAATEQPNPAPTGSGSASQEGSTQAGTTSSPAGFLVGALVIAAVLGIAFGLPAWRRGQRAARARAE